MEYFSLYTLIIIVVAYFAGTFPSAYLVTKLFTKQNILDSGTGNAGAMNTYEVTGSRYAGILVFLLDALKGVAAVWFAIWLTGNNFLGASIAAVWVILGHNYNMFQNYRGGRGLAAATGAIAAINPLGVILWLIMWFTGYYIIKKDVHVANAIACLGAPVLVFSAPDEIIYAMQIMSFADTMDYKILCAVICLIILIRHIEPLKAIFKEKES